MGKAGRWLRGLLPGKKEKDRARRGEAAAAVTPLSSTPGTPREKRWSFRRPVPAAGKCSDVAETPVLDQEKHAVAVAVATAAGVEAAVAAAHAAAAMVRMSSTRNASLDEDAAAVRIQATFRGYLARTALCALRGIVKLQAVVRGQLVRRQATATLRCMQALLAAQCQLRAQRMRVLQEHNHHHPLPPPRPRQSPQHPRQRRSYEMERSCEENAKVVEMDVGEPARRGAAAAARDVRRLFAEYHAHSRCSPAPSSEMRTASEQPLSPMRAYSGHFDELSLATAQSSPRHDSEASAAAAGCPSYMANTESSRAKARSQSAPRQRGDDDALLERQPSGRRKAAGTPPRGGGVRMQRSVSAARRLDASTASLNDSECGSTTSSVLTAATVYSRTRSLVGFEVRRGMY